MVLRVSVSVVVLPSLTFVLPSRMVSVGPSSSNIVKFTRVSPLDGVTVQPQLSM